MAISDELKKQLTDYLMLNCYDDQYIDRGEEKKFLGICVQKGVGVEEGLAFMRQAAAEKNLVVERDAEDRAIEIMERFATNDGRVDQKEFGDAVAIFRTFTKNKVPEAAVKKRLKEIMIERGWKPKQGMFSSWFDLIQ